MKSVPQAICVLVAAVGTFWSGFMWHASATAQIQALSLPAENSAAAVQNLLVASAHNNLWAAWGAMVAGVAVFLLLFFRDTRTPG